MILADVAGDCESRKVNASEFVRRWGTVAVGSVADGVDGNKGAT